MNQFMFNKEITFAGDKYWFKGLRANNVNEFEAIVTRYGLMNWLGNVYISFATLNEMPKLSFDKEEKKLQSIEFTKNFNSMINKYDFGLDFDAKEFSIDEVKIDVDKVTHAFGDLGFKKFMLKSSGRGLHIDVPFKESLLRGNIKNFNDLAFFYNDFCIEFLEDSTNKFKSALTPVTRQETIYPILPDNTTPNV